MQWLNTLRKIIIFNRISVISQRLTVKIQSKTVWCSYKLTTGLVPHTLKPPWPYGPTKASHPVGILRKIKDNQCYDLFFLLWVLRVTLSIWGAVFFLNCQFKTWFIFYQSYDYQSTLGIASRSVLPKPSIGWMGLCRPSNFYRDRTDWLQNCFWVRSPAQG